MSPMQPTQGPPVPGAADLRKGRNSIRSAKNRYFEILGVSTVRSASAENDPVYRGLILSESLGSPVIEGISSFRAALPREEKRRIGFESCRLAFTLGSFLRYFGPADCRCLLCPRSALFRRECSSCCIGRFLRIAFPLCRCELFGGRLAAELSVFP